MACAHSLLFSARAWIETAVKQQIVWCSVQVKNTMTAHLVRRHPRGRRHHASGPNGLPKSPAKPSDRSSGWLCVPHSWE